VICRFALPENRTELDLLIEQHQQVSNMADLWTTYTTLQSLAIASALLLYLKYWTFQVTAGVIPKAIIRFLTDGAVITMVIVLLCAAMAVVATVLAGPDFKRSRTFVASLCHMLETFSSGDIGMQDALLNVRLHMPLLLVHQLQCSQTERK
jgi:cytochrome bd-type quinol oxidase subunit 2